MRLASYFPNDPILELFTKYSKHEFIENGDDKCDAILCMSVTQFRRIPRDTGLPLIVHCWDIATNWRSWCRNESDYAKNVHRDSDIANQLHLLAEADLVIACSDHTGSVLHTMGIKSTTLHNFYYGEEIDKVLDGYEVKKKNRIIQVSRYALNKRFHVTLKMWTKIQDKYPDWELVFVGPYGDCYDELKGTCVPRVEMHLDMDRTKLIKMIADSNILVAPSLNEGYGLTPLEARHMGVDTVCSDEPWTHEFGYANRVFESDNLDAYVQAIEDTIARPANFSEKSSEMTPESYAKRFDALIKEIK